MTVILQVQWSGRGNMTMETCRMRELRGKEMVLIQGNRSIKGPEGVAQVFGTSQE